MIQLGEIKLKDFNPEASDDAKVVFWSDVPFDQVKEFEDNPMIHAQLVIDLSIDEFQYSNCSITVDENWVLLGGHGTKKSLMRNHTSIPYMIQVFGLKTEEDKMAFRMMLNKSGHDSAFDTELVRRNFERLVDAGYDLKLTGFNEAEQTAYLDEMREENSRNVEEIMARVGDGQGDAVEVKGAKEDDWTKDEWNPFSPPPDPDQEGEAEEDAGPKVYLEGCDDPEALESIKNTIVEPDKEIKRPFIVYMVFSDQQQAKDYLSSVGIVANYVGNQMVHVDMRLTETARRALSGEVEDVAEDEETEEDAVTTPEL